ncbi:hypothetical protein Tco_0335755 [Tanacetum coccineum]
MGCVGGCTLRGCRYGSVADVEVGWNSIGVVVGGLRLGGGCGGWGVRRSKDKVSKQVFPTYSNCKENGGDHNFQQEPDETLYQAWERFKELLMNYPQHYLTEMQEVILFYNGLDVPTRQILDLKGVIPTKTAADAKVAIQGMAEYSQKWHNGTSRTRTNSYGASHIDNSIPRKEKDPGSFTLPCYLNNVCFDNALADLGASARKIYIELGSTSGIRACRETLRSDDGNPPPPPPTPQTSSQQAPHTVSTIKLPIIKKGKYDIWAIKMEHYLAHTDYPIWEVIQKGNGPVSVFTDTNEVIKVLPPRIAEEILAREKERKARTTLLMALPEDHLAKFHMMTDAKEM